MQHSIFGLPRLLPVEQATRAGEANTKATMEECPGSAMDDFVSAPAVIITSWLQKWFPDTEDTLSNNQLNGLQAQVLLAVCHGGV